MTTKFNQDMYAKMRAKKYEPLSALGKRVVRVMDQGSPTVLATTIPRPTRVAFPTTSVEEITPRTKKARVADKGKEKASPRSSSVWDDIDLAQPKAQEVFTNDKLKTLSGVPPNKIVGCHVHKLVQVICSSSLPFVFFFFSFFLFFLKIGSSFQVLGETIHITSKYLSQKARASSAKSKAKGLEVELSKLREDLIIAMDEANTAKEKARVLSDDLRVEIQLTLEKEE